MRAIPVALCAAVAIAAGTSVAAADDRPATKAERAEIASILKANGFTSWRKIEFEAVAPPKANRAGIILTRHTDGAAWYDDVELVDVALIPDPPSDRVEVR